MNALLSPWRGPILCLMCCVTVVGTRTAAAQSTPVGAWDFILAGDQHGVAQITFGGDNTLSGSAAFTYYGRTAFRTNGNFVFTNLAGAVTLEGRWIYEQTNRIAGFLNEIRFGGAGGTNLLTNGLSFSAVVQPTQVTLLALGSQGRITFRGKPLVAGPDLTANYQGLGHQRSLPFPFAEIFTLSASGPNAYDVDGGGPGYAYTGRFLFSTRNYGALYQTRGQTGSNAVVTAYAGYFNAATGRGSMRGTDGHSQISYRVRRELP